MVFLCFVFIMDRTDDYKILQMFGNEETRDKAFALLVSKYSRPLYNQIRKILILHEDTDDILQETFIKIYSSLHTFRGDSGLYTWLFRIATNQALNYYKKQKQTYVFSALSYEDKLIGSLYSDEYFDGDELQLKLQKAVLKLPVKQRVVFNMKYFDDMKYEQIARILDTSEGALKASYHHAVKKIEKYLRED
jgi:RNA polymerase sigma-70 factor, ECF subfamily